ncbi:MAG: XDD4 family exosortase-dependent surface protein [Planctomycetia bacterium]
MFRPLTGLVPAALFALLTLIALVALPARGEIVLSSSSLPVSVSGTSAAGNPVSFLATFTTSGSTLFLDLVNDSPTPTSAPADVLASFYFDVFQNGNRASLQYAAASGQVYQVRSGTTDLYVPGSLAGGATDLRALTLGAGTWQFRQMDALLAPQLGFGIGTVGNSLFGNNGFDPKIVNQADYALYSTGTGTDIEPTGNLVDKLLVRGTASFAFTGLNPDLPVVLEDKFVFGLGTSPASTITAMPEPAMLALLAPSALFVLFAAWIQSRRAEGLRPRPGGGGAT